MTSLVKKNVSEKAPTNWETIFTSDVGQQTKAKDKTNTRVTELQLKSPPFKYQNIQTQFTEN